MNEMIYIMGIGRSGTTLLDVILGNNVNNVSLGELNRFLKRNGIQNISDDVDKGSLWKDIKLEVEGEFDEAFLSRQKENFKLFEYYTGVFVPRRLFQKRYKEYLSFNEFLLKSLSKRFSNQILIDSSKYPLRIRILKDLGINVRTIFIIRRPSSVVNSFRKRGIEQPPKSILSATLYYLIGNALCQFFHKRVDKFTKIKYEDLVTNPINTFKKISSDLQLDLTTLLKLLENNDSLKVGNLFEGNRIRNNKFIKIDATSAEVDGFRNRIIDFLLNPIYKI